MGPERTLSYLARAATLLFALAGAFGQKIPEDLPKKSRATSIYTYREKTISLDSLTSNGEGPKCFSISVGDINRDTYPDLAVFNGRDVAVYTQTGGLKFKKERTVKLK